MKTHHYIVFGASLVALATVGLFACKPEATPEAIEAKAWLVDFYKQYDIRGGWGFFGATAKDSNVQVVVNLPVQQGKELSMLNREDQARLIVFAACPPTLEKVWSILGHDGDIIIDARYSGTMITTVPCKATREGRAQ